MWTVAILSIALAKVAISVDSRGEMDLNIGLNEKDKTGTDDVDLQDMALDAGLSEEAMTATNNTDSQQVGTVSADHMESMSKEALKREVARLLRDVQSKEALIQEYSRALHAALTMVNDRGEEAEKEATFGKEISVIEQLAIHDQSTVPAECRHANDASVLKLRAEEEKESAEEQKKLYVAMKKECVNGQGDFAKEKFMPPQKDMATIAKNKCHLAANHNSKGCKGCLTDKAKEEHLKKQFDANLEKMFLKNHEKIADKEAELYAPIGKICQGTHASKQAIELKIKELQDLLASKMQAYESEITKMYKDMVKKANQIAAAKEAWQLKNEAQCAANNEQNFKNEVEKAEKAAAKVATERYNSQIAAIDEQIKAFDEEIKLQETEKTRFEQAATVCDAKLKAALKLPQCATPIDPYKVSERMTIKKEIKKVCQFIT